MNWEYPDTLTEEEKRFFIAAYEKCRPESLNIAGVVMVYGTGGPTEPHEESLKNLFYTPENYAINENTRNK